MTGELYTEQIENIGIQVLETARDELYITMRFLDVALSSFGYVPDWRAKVLGTDGCSMFYHPEFLGEVYEQNTLLVNRAYFHMTLHCLLYHLWDMDGRRDIFWNLACDITVESVVDGMQVRSVRRSQSWLRRETYRRLRAKLRVFTPKGICSVLHEWAPEEQELMKLVREFYVDEHSFWGEGDGPSGQPPAREKWQDISEQTETDMETFSKEASEDAGELLDQVRIENREKTDYRQFLRKFAVLREEIQIDTDSFDYSFYSYGLQLYGNMPLIEPQESKEVQKIEEFVIVIDTSMSCSETLVRKFLQKTYEILSESESFFRKFHIHIIQCDEKVQSDVMVTNGGELSRYMEHLELIGGGGTDFRPAFAYVDEMIENRKFEQLKGLLYFTDGFGTFPSRMPAYISAFVFLAEDYEERNVPAWAIKLILNEEELEK